MTKPITPQDIENVNFRIDDTLIEAINNKILNEIKDGSATIQLALLTGDVKGRIQWELIKKIYQKAGWKVTTDYPGYNENYPATITFSYK